MTRSYPETFLMQERKRQLGLTSLDGSRTDQTFALHSCFHFSECFGHRALWGSRPVFAGKATFCPGRGWTTSRGLGGRTRSWCPRRRRREEGRGVGEERGGELGSRDPPALYSLLWTSNPLHLLYRLKGPPRVPLLPAPLGCRRCSFARAPLSGV